MALSSRTESFDHSTRRLIGRLDVFGKAGSRGEVMIVQSWIV